MKRAVDDQNLNINVIDVREPDEYEIAHVEGVPLIPLSHFRSASRNSIRTRRFTFIARRGSVDEGCATSSKNKASNTRRA